MFDSLTVITKKDSRVFLYLVMALMLSACGFQLRGAIDLSEELAPVYIEQGTLLGLAREIKSLLATNKIKVVDKESESRSTLVLQKEVRGRRLLSVDGSGRAKEYLLTYEVHFIIRLKGSADSRDSLSISRSLLFDPDAVLAVSNESEILYRDMQRDISRLILLKLQALSRHHKAQSTEPVKTDTNTRE
jgi:LPS-assembly lipoprotein